jgi:hypothetical protein
MPGIAKAIREDYSPAPFFMRQEYQSGAERWVAWSSSLDRLKKLFYMVLSCFPEEVEILLKLEREGQNQPESDPWLRYHGICPLQELMTAIQENEDHFFLDGGSQLCVRCVGGGDYLVFDEHGIFFVYSDDDGFRDCCRELGFEERVEPLLYEAGHWHYRPVGNDKWEPFVQQFGLKAV